MKILISFFTTLLFASVTYANCTSGSAGTRCFDSATNQTIWLPKNGGKCYAKGNVGSRASLNDITCISSEGSAQSARALGGDLEDFEPEAENANFIREVDSQPVEWEI